MVLREGTVDSICEEEAQPKLAWSAGGFLGPPVKRLSLLHLFQGLREFIGLGLPLFFQHAQGCISYSSSMIILRWLNPTIQGRLELLSLSPPLPKSQLKAGG